MLRIRSILIWATITLTLWSVSAAAEQGVWPDRILLGQSAAHTGPAQALGTGMNAGLLAAFGKANDEGGVHGKRIELISKDDGYEPDWAINNTLELLEIDQVFALIGEVGTPTSVGVLPYVEEAQVPFIGPFTGAEFLRTPFKRYVVNVRGSYYQEMEKLAQYLVDAKGLKRIACFYQNDDYGKAGLDGISRALDKRKMRLVATGHYERNSIAVKKGLQRIRRDNPDAIVMVGAYKPCAEFIKMAKKSGMDDTLFVNISFVGTEALKNELGVLAEGVVISQVVHYPWDTSIPLVKEYHEALATYQPQAKVGFVTLEGYMVGKFFVMAAKSIEGEITREGLLDAIGDKRVFDLGGVVLEFGPEDHQGMDEVFLTVVRDGVVKPL